MTDCKSSQIKVLKTPKWAVPLALFVAVSIVVFTIFTTTDRFAFGNIFPFLTADAQNVTWRDWNKIGVSSASPLYNLTSGGVRNAAALSGPGGSIVGIVQGDDDGWVAFSISFINEAHGYCITPVLRLDARPNDWSGFFNSVAAQVSNQEKVVISIGNEINHDNEWPQSQSPEEYGRYLSSAYDQIKAAMPNATVIGPPMNTSAPCTYGDDSRTYIGADSDRLRYMCWIAFMKGMESGSPGVLSKMDGHASHSYPIAPDGFGAGRSMTIYQWEKDVISGFSGGYQGKDVYIMETGLQSDWLGRWSDNNQFVSEVMNLWNPDGSVVMVNFFNAMGSNTDSIWTVENPEFIFDGSEVVGLDGGGTVSNPRVKFSADAFARGEYSCEIVDRSEYVPMSGAGGMYSSARCISDILTPLIPVGQKYSGTGAIQLQDGIGGAYALMTVKEVSVTSFLQNLNVENNTDVGNMSSAAAIDKTFAWDVNYNLIANYPADGRYYHKATPRVESWMDEACMNENGNNQEANSLGIPREHWPFQTNSGYAMDQCGYGTDFNSRTMYADHLFHSSIKKRDYVYFPLGTALGAVSAEDPYNIYAYWMKAADFMDEEGQYFEGTFRDQTASLDYFINFLLSKWTQFWLGILGWLDDGVDNSPKFTSVPGGLTMSAAYTKAKSSGEAGVEIGDFDYNGSCSALEELISYYNNEVLPAYNGYVANACSTGVTNPDCWNGVLPPSDPECQPRSTEKCPGVRKAQSDARSALSTIQSLYERCMGNGTTRMKIAGIQQNDLAELELSAPFVPIMAQYRIWDVINARGTVCDIPDNGLYGAEVTVDVSWYDKHGSAAGQSYMTCDHGGTGVGPQNLLRNGSFEEAWGGSPGGTASGAAAPGWTFIWKKNTSDTCNLGDGQNLEYCKAPEFQPIDGIYDQRRVLDGNLASKWFTFANKHDVIAYQVVDNVPSGYNLFGYFQGWRNSDTGDGTFRDESGCVQTEAGYVGDSQAEICVYNGDIRNIVGGEHEIPMGAYDGMMAEIRANGSCAMISNEAFFNEWHSGIVNSGSGQVTVILRASATVPAFNTDDYWDNICLVPTGSAVTKSVEIPPTPPRTGSDDECRFYNPPEQSCELQIGGGSGKKLFSEEMTFYMPGLGVMPYIAERLETGSSKSPDTNIDAPMCKDRRDSDVNHNYNKAYSALDVYIIQNLPNKYAHNFAKFIAPVDYDRDEINLMKNASRVDVGGGVYVRNPGEPAPAGYNRFATTNELLIMQSAKNYGLSKEQTAYVLATAKFESSVQPKEEYGCCDRRYDETRCTSASQDPCGCTAVHQWYGACNPITNQCYYGRGFVQLTHEGNYQRMGNYLNKPLASNPSLALDPNTAAEIIVFGMKAGSFTGRALESSYPGTIEAYIPARSIINGDTYNICSRSDCNGTETVGEHVARIAYSYLNGSVMNTY